MGDKGRMPDEQVDEIAHGLAGSDLVGLSSMTGYADLTHRVIKRLRELSPSTYIVWGGIHPIIQPEDAILGDVDAVCTGEGEFAFEELHQHLEGGRDHTATKNFWFKPSGGNGGQEIVKNHFLPLMSVQEMEKLPFPQYGAPNEKIYLPGQGFVKTSGSSRRRRSGFRDDRQRFIVDRLHGCDDPFRGRRVEPPRPRFARDLAAEPRGFESERGLTPVPGALVRTAHWDGRKRYAERYAQAVDYEVAGPCS